MSLRIPDGMPGPDTPDDSTPITCPTEYKRWRDLTLGDVVATPGVCYGEIVDHVTIERDTPLVLARLHLTDGSSEWTFLANLWTRVARAIEVDA